MKRNVLAVAAVVFTVAGASAAQAQAPLAKPITFGASAGLSMPNGDISDGYNTGFHITGLADHKLAAAPVSIRGELSFQSIGGKEFGIPGASMKLDNMSMLMVTGNAVYHFAVAPKTPVRPYLIGGLGMYNYKGGLTMSSIDPSTGQVTTISASDRMTKLGLNGGIGTGFQLGTMSTFAELRIHNVFADGGSLRVVPLSFGIMF